MFAAGIGPRLIFNMVLNINESEMVVDDVSGLILDLRPANERRRYFVTPSLIGWVQA